MEAYGNLEPIEKELLDKNILEIVGQINETMMMKVREAVTIFELDGLPKIEILILSDGGDSDVALFYPVE